MKILICTSYFHQTHNGAGQFVQLLSKINNNFKEHQVAILSEDIDESMAAKNKLFFHLNLHRSKPLIGFELIKKGKHFLGAAKSIKKKFNFDVIFFNNVILGFYAKQYFPEVIKVGFIHDDNYLNFGLSNFSFTKRWAYRYLQHRQEKRAAKNMDLVLTNSKFMWNAILNRYSIDAARLKQIYIPVESSSRSILNQHWKTLNKEIDLLFVKNEYQRGGLEDLIDSIEDLPFQYNIRISVIGPTPSELHSIKQLFKNKRAVLNFIGNVDQNTLFIEMMNHHALCIPSRMEAQGLTVIEGMSKGIPVITTNAGGLKEMTNNNSNAWIAEPSNVSSLTTAIMAFIITSEEEKQNKIDSAKAFVDKTFPLDQMHHLFLQAILKTTIDKPS